MNLKSLKVIFFGTPEFVVPVLEKLYQNFQLLAVVTAPPKKVGRKQILTVSPITQALKGLKTADNLKGDVEPLIIAPEKLNQDVAQSIAALKPDLLVVAAYGKIIPQEILDIPRLGALNIHPSLLPKYRGPSPIQSAILAGDSTSGVTIIKLDEQMDHGPILASQTLQLLADDTFASLSKKLFAIGGNLLMKIIPDYLNGCIHTQEQDHHKATISKMIRKNDGYFDLNNPPQIEQLDRMIRAYYPWPGAWTKWNNKVIKFLPIPSQSESTNCHPELVSGSSVKMLKQAFEAVSPQAESVQHDRYLIQMEGKKPIKLTDFLNGHPDFPLKTLI